MADTLYNQAMNNQSKLSNIQSSIPPLAADAWLSTRWFYHNDHRIIRPGNIRFISTDSFLHTVSITFNKNAKEKNSQITEHSWHYPQIAEHTKILNKEHSPIIRFSLFCKISRHQVVIWRSRKVTPSNKWNS